MKTLQKIIKHLEHPTTITLVNILLCAASIGATTIAFAGFIETHIFINLAREQASHYEEMMAQNQKLTLLQMQQQIRTEVYLPFEREFHDLDAEHYPENGRHYNEAERARIRRYYSTVVMHEWVVFHYFPKGQPVCDIWSKYEELVKSSMSFAILRQEYAAFRSEPLGSSQGIQLQFRIDLEKLLNGANLDFDQLLKDRQQDMAANNESSLLKPVSDKSVPGM